MWCPVLSESSRRRSLDGIDGLEERPWYISKTHINLVPNALSPRALNLKIALPAEIRAALTKKNSADHGYSNFNTAE